MKESKALRLLRALIREEIGRNFHSVDTMPYSWEDYPEADIEIYPSRGDIGPGDHMMYNVKITCKFDPSLSVPLSRFKDESEAKEFARKHAENIHRAYMAKDPAINGTFDLG